MTSLLKIWGIVLDAFFPPICLNCKSYLETSEKDNLICNSCLTRIKFYKTVFRTKENVTLMAATSYQEPALKELVHSFKYKRFIKAQKPLGKLLVNYLLAIGFKGEENLIVPIPLHPARERTRGFNQAEVIAKLTADYLKLPVVKVLKRVRKTSPQIDLPKELREENVKNAFDLIDKSVSIKGKSVILVDDVYTTGATMKEAAKVLKKNGVKEIKFLVLAKTD